MSMRRLFMAVFVAFAVIVSSGGGYLAWREASRAVEAELDRRASWIAGAAAETGLQASLLLGLEPGYEDEMAWTLTHNRLRRLLRYVREAYIVDGDNRALVSTLPADSVPIGTPLRFLDGFQTELAAARRDGNATTPAFRGLDGQLYKWGFALLEQSDLVLAVLMPADYLSPLSSLRKNLILWSALAALLAAFLGILLAGRVVRPLERLSGVALRIERGRLDEPVAVEGVAEMGRLSGAMERMRQGILERDEQLRLMLAQVAHEIRNPLGGLELFASAAVEAEDPEERRRLLCRIRQEVSALNGIIDDFLTFARPMNSEAEAADLRSPLLEAAELVRMEMEERGASLEVVLPEEPLAARVGAHHAKRAVLNLLRNAAQAADRVTLRASRQNGEVVISVRDDGPGVDPEVRDRIFEPFVSDKQQGAGLGLAIVRKIAEAHGGRVELVGSSREAGGSGAEFRVYFPGGDRTAAFTADAY
ncbi:MAG: ATP-binding protein [Gemmatimonadota bacterium]